VRPRGNGIALIEVMIVVILISVLATVFWNLQFASRGRPSMESAFEPADTAIRSGLDEIRRHLSLARRTRSVGSPITIEKGDVTDTIEVRYHGRDIKYYVDDHWNLTRVDGGSTEVLASNVEALKVTRLGMKTLVVTMVARSPQGGGEGDSLSLRSFSAVVPAEGIWR
jgi:hypothetical protein